MLVEKLLRVDVTLHVLSLRLEPRYIGDLKIPFWPLTIVGTTLDVGCLPVDEVLDGKTLVDKTLDLLHTITIDIAADLGAVIRHHVHHLAIGVREAEVVLESGALETSNVNAVGELVNIITHARMFEMNLKLMQTTSENAEKSAQLLQG